MSYPLWSSSTVRLQSDLRRNRRLPRSPPLPRYHRNRSRQQHDTSATSSGENRGASFVDPVNALVKYALQAPWSNKVFVAVERRHFGATRDGRTPRSRVDRRRRTLDQSRSFALCLGGRRGMPANVPATVPSPHRSPKLEPAWGNHCLRRQERLCSLCQCTCWHSTLQ